MFQSLTDQSLLGQIRDLVRIERQTTLKVLEYLAEIDSRRLWLKEGYSSLFDFCVRFLNYSESEAARRIHSARCAAKVEEVKPLIEQNTLSLTGLSLIAPFVTKENAAEILPMVQNKSAREIEKVIHQHFPESKPPAEYLKIALDDELKRPQEGSKTLYPKKECEGFLSPETHSLCSSGNPTRS